MSAVLQDLDEIAELLVNGLQAPNSALQVMQKQCSDLMVVECLMQFRCNNKQNT